MPRKKRKTEVVQNWRHYHPDRWYAVLIVYLCIMKNETSRRVHVTLEHLDEAQAGRVHHVDLPRPIMPSGLRAPNIMVFRVSGGKSTGSRW